jgi:DNA polymerase-4
MDAFFASVEQRDNPALRGKPVAVGGSGGRGVVAAASYEARRYGVTSAMPSSRAKRLCPHLIFVPSDFARYRAASRQVFEIFRSVTDMVEGLSVDEAYLDVTQNNLGLELGRDVARYIRARIWEETQLTASAGVAPNKFLAKIASDIRKPNGMYIIPPQRVDAFVAQLKVEKINGVGPSTAKRLHKLGARTCADIRRLGLARMENELGKHGRWLFRLAHGEDDRPVVSHRVAKSRGAESTFAHDVTDIAVLDGVILGHAERIGGSLKKADNRGRTITLKVRYEDFTTITRSKTLPHRTDDATIIGTIAKELMRANTQAGTRPVRLLGVSVSGLEDGGPEQLWLDLQLP